MLNNLDSSIATISEEQMNDLFADVPGTPGADDLTGGKQPETKKVKENEVIAVNQDDLGEGIETIDNLDDFLKEKEEEDDDTKTPEDKDKKDKAGKKSKEETKTPETPEGEDEEEEVEKSEDELAISSVLKNTMDFLIEKGEWLDFEGREDLEVDPKVYAELTVKQNQAKVSEMFKELVDSTGPYGKAIIGFVKQGGDPEAVIDIFKEQKQIENFDTDSEEGQRLLISKYYKEVIGWKPEKIERHIKSLIADDELETETTDIKALYDEHTQKKLTQVAEQHRAEAAKQQEREERFKDTIVSAIDERKDLSDREKKFIQKSALQYSNRLSDGTQVSDFYVKFAQVQADPKEYIDLMLFVMDKENYVKKLKANIKTAVAEETFNFVKGNSALSNKKGSGYDKVKRESKQIGDFDFGLSKK